MLILSVTVPASKMHTYGPGFVFLLLVEKSEKATQQVFNSKGIPELGFE